MAYIPSRALMTAIENCQSGLFIDKMHDGGTALVCKMPEVVIKALSRGADCSFLLGVVRAGNLSMMCLGLRVLDEPDHPLSTMKPNSSPEDRAHITEILASRTTRLHCVNELNHPVLSGECSLEPVAAQGALSALRSANPFSLTPDTAFADLDGWFFVLEQAMKRFQTLVYNPEHCITDESPTEMIAIIPLILDIWEPTEIIEVSLTAQEAFLIGDTPEGTKLERQVYLAIDSIYPGSTYRSLTTAGGELDILGFDTEFLCVIESKSLSVLGVDKARSSERRAATIEGHVSKAMRQLRGALRAIRSGKEIVAADGQPITIQNQQTLPAQAIVLLSEMYFFLDWQQIARDVVAASEDETRRALFHVMDLMELTYIVSQSRSADAFNRYMAQRWLRVKEKGTASLRSRKAIERE